MEKRKEKFPAQALVAQRKACKAVEALFNLKAFFASSSAPLREILSQLIIL